MSKKIRLGLIGASGRLGSSIEGLHPKDKFEITSKIGRSNMSDFDPAKADVFVDVSLPEATEKLLSQLLKANASVPYVVGCTGLKESQVKIAQQYAQRAAVILAPNFAPSVNLLLGLLEQASPLLAKWGYSASVSEIHHTRKLDAPSGTAKAIVERLGRVNSIVHSTRAGNIVGTHEVRFFGSEDVLTLTHEALDRGMFAKGALLAAEWAAEQKSPGFYSMRDVIGLR